jgi:CheY-like chemotaxis protein/HPt (histidine-containing phosphotransfer) domain-containing protein
VLTNLLSNALKFTEQGEVILRVELQSETESSATLAFSVSDTGIGITEEQRKKLFSAFTQADLSMSRKYGGTGLGLVISQRLVSLMQSEIHLKSQRNEGSNFHFTLQLPKKVGELSIVNKQENTATADLSAPLSVLNGYVLLVEDNLVNQEVALAMLHKIGIQAEVACNGEIALAMLKQNRFDVILMDCQMPIMDGFETTAHIRAKEITQSSKPTPIIALTANAIMGDKESCLAKGMDDYLSKPFTLAQLHDTLRPWLPTQKISSSAPLETLANSATTTHVFAHIDKKVIAQLEHLGNNVLSRVITFFAQTGPEILYEIETAIANSSCEQVYKSAHNLKNSAANLGATELAACCKELESQGRANLLQNADLLLNKARHLYELSLAELIDIQHGTHHG